ncbi:hypothetical protein MASR2M48_11620 [Spirochaetota bacterium]
MYNFKEVSCNSVDDLLDLFPQENEEMINRGGEFSSPYTSTIPLIILVKDFPELLDPFHIDGQQIFEYETKPKKGIGRASCSDLAVIDDFSCLIVEAKRTEPKYELVEKWFDHSKNRKLVLEGWLDFINEHTGKSIKIEDIMDIPYQAVHRTASACAVKKKNTKIAYFLFDINEEKGKYYKDILRKLKRLTGNTITYYYCLFRIKKTKTQLELEAQWDNGVRNLEKEVKTGIINSNLMKIVKKDLRDL